MATGDAEKQIAAMEEHMADLTRKLAMAQAQIANAERRATEAEKAYHELVGQKAVEGMASRRKFEDMEAQAKRLQAMDALKAEIAAQLTAELDCAEKRTSSLRAQLERVKAV